MMENDFVKGNPTFLPSTAVLRENSFLAIRFHPKSLMEITESLGILNLLIIFQQNYKSFIKTS